MSLFGTLNTGVSGMAAQANMLSTIGDNIANSNTTGYKDATTAFETLLGNQSANSYTAGGVSTQIRYGISTQGQLNSSTSVTDLAIQGNGFFVVQGTNGSTALTRAGSFVPNAAGNLVNTAGYSLMGYNLTDGSSATVNGTGGLQVMNLSKQSLTDNPSTAGSLVYNLNSTAPATTATTTNLPAGNTTGSEATATSSSSFKTSIAAYDDLGNAVTFDIYFTKTSTDTTTGNSTWQAAVFNQADAATTGTSVPFPYNVGGSPDTPIATSTLVYSGTTGKLTSATAGGTPSGSTTPQPLALAIQVPHGAMLNLDISKSTQLASNSNVTTATVNGSAPSKLDHVTIGTDGTVTSVYTNGIQQATYRIPLADVPSENNLTALSGNVYEPSLTSGSMTIGTATTGSLGSIQSNELENSTVDLATELTNMISTQRSYEANSKVIQASSDLLKVVDQLSG